MPDLVDFGGGGALGVGRQSFPIPPTIYTKIDWSDEWTISSQIWATHCSWPVAPSLPTATLIFDYGWLRSPPTYQQYAQAIRLRGMHRLYVKVECGTNEVDPFDDPTGLIDRNWYGFIDFTADSWGGVVPRPDEDGDPYPIATGTQEFTAYGLEKLLADQQIDGSWFRWNNPETLASEVASQERPITFNDGGKPNRTSDREGGAGYGGTLTSYVFESEELVSAYWSTANIVEYLMRRTVPRDKGGVIRLPFDNALAIGLPTWDVPEIEVQEGDSVYSLLSRLIDRRRLWLWWLEVQETESGADFINLKTATMTPDDIPLPIKGSTPIPGNAAQIDLRFDFDQGTSVAIAENSIEAVDQTIALGAPRRSVFSVSMKDLTFEEGFGTGITTEYSEGASRDEDWDEIGTKEREKRTAEARSAVKLDDVFSLYQIPASFGFVVGDGLGGLPTFAQQYSVFPDDTKTRNEGDNERPASVPAHMGSSYIEQSMPLIAGVDYSGDKIETGDVDETTAGDDPTELPPLVIFRVPETAKEDEDKWRWIRIDDVGQNADKEVTDKDELSRWSASVFVPTESASIKLRVTGAPQHILDNETRFVPLEHQGLRVDTELPPWDIHEGAIITVSMQDPRRAQGRYPESVTTSRDYVRTKQVFAGDEYTQNYVVPETVVGIDSEGKLIRSTGGFLPYPGADGNEDNVTRLKGIARVAHEWYGKTRRAITLRSDQLREPNNAAEDPTDFVQGIDRGVFVINIGNEFPDNPDVDNYQEVNSIITLIEFEYPVGGKPRMTVQTFAGELDAMQVAPMPAGMMRGRPGLGDAPAMGPAVSDTPFSP